MIKPPMMNSTAIRPFKTVLLFAAIAAATASAQTPQPRITRAIDNTSRATLPGTLSPRALPANDVGAVPASTKLQGITLVFSRTQAQQAALDALVAVQQNPASPQYHQWLTPAQFGAQFGVAASDIAATEAWLQQQGFTIDGVSNSRDRIQFSGTEGQVESAFATQLHYFKFGTETNFAPATALSIPAALVSSVLSVENLSSFRPLPHAVLRANQPARPSLTSSQTGNIFLTPGDVSTIYDINAAYSAGYTGAGQSIAIVGQSAIVASDITGFQTAIGLTPKAPTQLLVPNTGTSAINPFGAGDEGESDLDLEYSSSIAKGATIYFVYTGSDTNAGGVFTSVQYAIDENIAPIISESYGGCELAQGTAFINQFNAILEQASAQGQTIVNAAGDSGSTDCYGTPGLSAADQEALAVDYPGSSQYVTALGGSEFPPADTAAGNSTYFDAESSTDIISSAKSYIPEEVWNDDAIEEQIASGGGGTSIYIPRPSWQAGTIGGVSIPSGNFRLVPDISLDASNYSAPYVFCSSDSSTWNTATDGGSPPYQVSSCTSGLRDSTSQDFTIAGGTSFATPIFAGMLAIINQARGYTNGQGNINSTLYTLASNPTTYASAFHDIAAGGNQCLAGTGYCTATGASEYPATVGYDEASGLGSVDLFNLLTAWPASTGGGSGLTRTITTVAPASLSPALGANDTITITVASASGLVTATPSGTISLSINGTVVNPALPLTNGSATYTFSSSTAGTASISATYSGSTTYAASTGTVDLNVGAVNFNLAVPNITIAAGSSGPATITATPGNGYTGTIELTLSLVNATATTTNNFCATYPSSLAVTSAAAVTGAITFYTSEESCTAAGLMKGGIGAGKTKVFLGSTKTTANNHAPAQSPWKSAPLPIAFAGLLVAGCFRRRSRILRGALALGLLALIAFSGLGLTGCSSSASGTSTTTITDNAPTGVYTFSLSGTDSVNSAIISNTTFTVTIN